MKNQFKINQCDRFAIDFDNVKFVYVEFFLRKKSFHTCYKKQKSFRNQTKNVFESISKNFLKLTFRKHRRK